MHITMQCLLRICNLYFSYKIVEVEQPNTVKIYMYFCQSMSNKRANVRRIRCEEDFNSSPIRELEETTGTPPYCHTTWMKTTQQDLESLNLSMNEAIDVAQNHPLWRMMSTFGATHSQWCMPEMNERMKISLVLYLAVVVSSLC